MTEQGAYGSRLGECFGLRNPPTLITRTLRRGELAITQIGPTRPGQLMTKPIPQEDAFLIALMIRDCPEHELWVDGQPVNVRPVAVGALLFYALQSNLIALIHGSFGSLMFYLPRLSLDAIADAADAPHIETLHVKPGRTVIDPVLKQLGSTLLPVLKQPKQVNGLFVDHVLQAFGAHVAHTYGGMRIASRAVRGGLAAWQERRAKELMDASINADVSLQQLAHECRLSVSHFARAFRQSTGIAPHRWLMEHRVERAKDRLRDVNLSLADVALACGFADQSHLTRVFTRALGVSPGAWRRARNR